MNLSAWSLRNPVAACLLFLLLTVMGLQAFQRMRVQNFPDIEVPTVSVVAAWPGASPVQMETDVARKLENALSTVPGLKHLHTTTQDGSAVVTAEFPLDKPIQAALDDVRDAVGRARAELPADLREPSIVKANLAGGAPILAYAFTSSVRDEAALTRWVDESVSKALVGLRGVGAVTRVGGRTRQVQVDLDPDRLAGLQLSVLEVSRQLRGRLAPASAGRALNGNIEHTLRASLPATDPATVGAIDISLADGRRFRLDQLATVRDGLADPSSLAFHDGQPVVALEVTRARGAGEVQVGQVVRAEIARLQAAHPNVQFTEVFNQVDAVADNFSGSMHLLYEGALLAVVVVWVFLRDWRATLVAATALPLSVIPGFAAMDLAGYSINVVTLLSLSLVVGVLVDDAIVEIENIMRHLQMGKSPAQAAMEAADEIGLAVVATTLTLMAVFIPTAFMSGVAGRFFVQFGWTAAMAVFFSLVVARLLTPMMAAWCLRPAAGPVPRSRLLPHYLTLARWCLSHRTATTLVVLLLSAGAVMVGGRLDTGFMPPDDLSQTQVSLELPPGSTLEQTRIVADRALNLVKTVPQVQHVYTTIGGGAAGIDSFVVQGAAEPRRATLTLALAPRAERAGVTKQAVERELRKVLTALAGVRTEVGLPGSTDRYVLVLTGERADTLLAQARRVEREIRGLDGIGPVRSTANLLRPELVASIDGPRAALLGVTTEVLADTLRVATAGDADGLLARVLWDDRQVPVLVRLPASDRGRIDPLQRLWLPGSRGPVRLGEIATFEWRHIPAQIDRLDRQRQVSIGVDLGGRSLGSVEAEVLALPSVRGLPADVKRQPAGDAEAMDELFDSFGVAMATGVLCIYAVLVLLFRDALQPLTILLALLLSVPGALLALFVTGTSLSMPSMIGLIMLMGIATKNSILLVEYVIAARRDHAMNREEALLDACRKRARPIVMTTLAMGAGMMPIALGWGVDPSFRAPMAIVVIGGLITSTVLSLLVIPVAYTLLDDAAQALARIAVEGRGRMRARTKST